jgi:bifunctional non-homologous end joining protein LigD
MSLTEYRRKRRFDKTPEPAGKPAKRPRGRQPKFVVQQHAASRLHYDFRLELEGTLKSWAVPKGPCLDPSVKRLAVQVEDHPLEYATFEGSSPEGQYGAGEVIVWDRGRWLPPNDAAAALRRGKLEFGLEGEKLHGGWLLLRMSGEKSDGGKNWLLVKRQDEAARPLAKYDITAKEPQSVKSGRRLEELKSPKPNAPKANRARASERSNGKPRARRAKRARSSPRRSSSRADPLPESIDLELATLVDQPPTGDEWLHEIKFDGYRLVARVDAGRVQLLTRNHLDWTHRYTPIAEALAALPVDSAILDGEVVVQLASGLSSFQALQNALRDKSTDKLIYYAFDLLYLNGHDLRSQPLESRKELLRELLATGPHPQVQYSDHWTGDGPQFLRECCQRGVEGIISKRKDRPYLAARTLDWLKIKCTQHEELVIGGFTESEAKHRDFGALLVGYFDNGQLIYSGRVGTGFDARLLADLRHRLNKIETGRSPFAAVPARDRRAGTRWVQPKLVAQVEFTGWTDGDILRHPSFQGLREDKRATDIGRPESLPSVNPTSASSDMKRTTKRAARRKSKPSPKPAKSENLSADLPVRLTNPDRVLYPETGLTKRGLAEYYAAVADWILPHLEDRPLSMLRCPEGRESQCFFQKHAAAGTPEALRRIDIQEKDEVETYLIADDLPGLLSLAQMSILEIHLWGSRGDRLEQPDRLVFDLDPGEGVPWSEVVKAAFEVREALEKLDLESFVKTTGGKGLHVVAPLAPRRHEWDFCKNFTRSIAERFAAEQPERFIATMAKARRRGKIFIDFFRNDRGATAVAPYSTRAKPSAPVSCPLTWDELIPKIGPAHFTVANVPPRLKALRRDPWHGFFQLQQQLPKRAVARH